MADDKPQAGFFFMPVTGDFFHTTPDGGVFRNGRKMRLAETRTLSRKSVLLVPLRFHQRWRVQAHFPGKIRSLGSTVAHFCYVATGGADAVLVWNVHVCELAAGIALLTNNGGVLTRLHGGSFEIRDLLSGEPLSYPVLAGLPKAVESFFRIIEPRHDSTGTVGQ